MNSQRVQKLIGTPLVMKRDGQGFGLFLKMDRTSRNNSSFHDEPLPTPSQHRNLTCLTMTPFPMKFNIKNLPSILWDPTPDSRHYRDILDFSISSFSVLLIQELIFILPPVLPIQRTLLLLLHVCLSHFCQNGILTSISPCPPLLIKKILISSVYWLGFTSAI